MAWKKAPAELIEAFYAALPDDGRIERRKMFGFPCAFVNGNMFTGIHEDNVIVRLSEAERTTRADRAEVFEPFPGRKMREYLAVPEDVKSDPEALASWIADGLAFAAALPPKLPKQPKPPKPRKKKAG